MDGTNWGPRKAVLWLCGERRRDEVSELWPQAGARDTQSAPTTWLGWLDSNQRMRESKSRALPLGYTPMWSEARAGADAPALSLIWGG